MDFKRIARIFILTFGLLNIYLLIGVLNREDIQDTSSQPSSDILANMADSNIELPSDISQTDSENLEVYSLQINENNDLVDALEVSEIHTGTIDSEGVY